MKITHSTPIPEFIDLGLCNTTSEKDFEFLHASRLKRLLISGGWHESDIIPQVELSRLAELALGKLEIEHRFEDPYGDEKCDVIVDEADEGYTRCEKGEEEHAR